MTGPSRRHAPPLPWLAAFEAAARRASFTAAADELGLTQAAVSQQIRLLEARLGRALFVRRARGVALTAEGAAFLPHVQAALAGLNRSIGDLFGQPADTVVTIRVPISFAALWLAPRLAGFARAVPGVTLDLATAHVPEDYPAEPRDIEIRFGLGDWPNRASFRLTTERLTPVAAPALAAGHGDGWTGLPLLSVQGGREMWADWFALAGAGPASGPLMRFDSFVAALAAAEAGAGVLLGSRPLVDAALAAGRLARLSDLELPSRSGHFAVSAAGTTPGSARMRVLRWLAQQAAG